MIIIEFPLNRLIEVLNDDPITAIFIFIQQLNFFYRMLGGQSGLKILKQMTMEAKELFKKPMVIVLEPDEDPTINALRQELEEDYHSAGLATFSSFDLAARVCVNLYQYNNYLAAAGKT